MCGIAGYFVSKPNWVDAPTLQLLACNLLRGIENRGMDATGYAYVSVKDKSVYLAKAPVPVSKFLQIPGHMLNNQAVKHMPRGMILHTRAATQGDPSDNRNNHPIYSKSSALCMIHNGWISNDTKLLGDHDITQDAEVDSEVYLRLIEHFYLKEHRGNIPASIKHATGEVFGSLACAMIQGGRTDKMWVWKDTGALYLVEMDWGWVFGSTKMAVLGAVLASCNSLNGIIKEFIDPTISTLYTFSTGGLDVESGITSATWNQTSGMWDGDVIRTWVDGKLVSVKRRKSGGKTFRYLDEDYKGYDHYDTGYRGNYSAAKQSGLSGVAKTGTYTPYQHTKTSTNTRCDWEPKVHKAERLTWVERFEATKPIDCFCRTDYACMQCREANKYYAHPVECRAETPCEICKKAEIGVGGK